MKCELCHQAEATEAIIRGEAGEDDELYVCAACAKAARAERQRKSSRTRTVSGLPPGVSMSITEISSSGEGSSMEVGEGDEPPPIIGAIMNAFEGLARNLDGLAKKCGKLSPAKKLELPATRAAIDYRVRGGFHLEGLFLIGELEAVKRAFHAMGLDLVGLAVDGLHESGHVYHFMYTGSTERAKRVAEDLLREEKNARRRLRTEMQRVFGDAICRALAILKNCRLLSSGELFDLLSPLRLAAKEGLLEGISLTEIEDMMGDQDFANEEIDDLSPEERDRVDSARADEMNKRFEEVMFNDVF